MLCELYVKKLCGRMNSSCDKTTLKESFRNWAVQLWISNQNSRDASRSVCVWKLSSNDCITSVCLKSSVYTCVWASADQSRWNTRFSTSCWAWPLTHRQRPACRRDRGGRGGGPVASGRKRLHTAAFHRSKVTGIREANSDSTRSLLIGCDGRYSDEVIMMFETQLCVKKTSFYLLQRPQHLQSNNNNYIAILNNKFKV